MKVVVLGATGKTGRLVVEKLWNEGHDVTGFVRSTMHVASKERLRYVQGEARNRESFDRAIEGQNAVISATSMLEIDPQKVNETFVRNLTGAMEAANVKRLVFLARGSSHLHWKDVGWFVRAATLGLGRELVDDQANAIEVLHASSLDFIDVRPSKLIDGPATNLLCAAGDHERIKWKVELTRADVVDFVVKQLAENEWLRKRVFIGHARG